MLFDFPTVFKKDVRLRELPHVETQWRPPQYFPNLSSATVIGIDVETRELDDLSKYGPGWGRGNRGHIVGFSVAALDQHRNTGKWYFPIRHTVEPEWNLDPTHSLHWLKYILEGTPAIPKIGQNLIYDIGWLTTENIYVTGKLYDTSFAEALLDERGDTNLEWLGEKYLGHGKKSSALYDWCALAYGGKPNGTQRANIYRAPPRLVGPYGEDDADMPIHILALQWRELEAQGLLPVFDMECEFIRMLVRMRLAGVTIDINRAEQIYRELGMLIKQKYAELSTVVGFKVETVNSPAVMSKIFQSIGIKPPTTDTGRDSFRKEWLTEQHNPVADLVNSIRGSEKVRGTFVKGYLLESHIPIGNGRGKVHCQFHPLRTSEDDKSEGALTGRFASSTPNLQNIPFRTAEGRLVREAFIPHNGHTRWRSKDYNQIEYRMLAHFATSVSTKPDQYAIEMAAANKLRQTYIDNPKTDYHDATSERVKAMSGVEIIRSIIKNINFSLIYGVSQKTLHYKYLSHMNDAQVKELMAAYYKGAPYAKATMSAISQEVQRLGYVTTIWGRRTRFNLWEPAFKADDKRGLPLDRALAVYGNNIRRAYDYKGTNYKLQGSAADIIKAAMVRAYTEGVFDVTGMPVLQVHDELDFSVIDDSARQVEAYKYIDHILETTTPTNVPIIVKTTDAANWGKVK